MKIFKIGLTRTYIVKIKAESEDAAKVNAEFFLGDLPDLSTEKDRNERKFKIEETEMVENDAFSL